MSTFEVFHQTATTLRVDLAGGNLGTAPCKLNSLAARCGACVKNPLSGSGRDKVYRKARAWILNYESSVGKTRNLINSPAT